MNGRNGEVDGPPFGLPVLAEAPDLASALETARRIDRLQAQLVDQVQYLQDTGLAERCTGVGLDQWLASIGRQTRTDRRMVQTAARVLRRLPSVQTAFDDGRLSWSQIRTLVLKVNDLPRHLDDRLDAALAQAVATVHGDDGDVRTDPDALAHVVTWVLADLHEGDPDATTSGEVQDQLVLQPRLDGTGGRYWGDAGPEGFAVLDAATDPGRIGTATRDGFADTPDPDRAATQRTRVAAARAEALYHRLRTTTDTDGATTVAAPTVLCRVELSTLLGQDGLPAQLLTTLAGGRMHVTSDTAKQLADRYGSDLRLVLLDDGHVVGVGRKRYQPAGWLREATLALHDVCTEPGCLVAARSCDTDHATPYTDPAGRTDVDQLAPLCPTANHAKERDGWTADQTPDGTRTWHHHYSGLTIRTLPAMWRPPRQTGDPPGDPTPPRSIRSGPATFRPRPARPREGADPPRDDGFPF